MLWTVDPSTAAPLHEQIAAAVRRAVSAGELVAGERLPPTAELAAALRVDPNTVLAAFRRLRDEGVLEFRRGRGVRVAEGAHARAPVFEAARALLDLGRREGYTRAELIDLLGSL